MPNNIEVLDFGTRVLLKDRTIEAEIVGVICHSLTYVQYQVVWWDGNQRRIEWIESQEVEHRGARTNTIGFHKPSG